MGYLVYSFPGGDLDLVAKTLRETGADVVRCDGPGRFGSLRSRRGFACAKIVDVSEKKEAVPHFNVATGRNGLVSAVLLWPIDRKHVHEFEEMLKTAGASPVVFEQNEKAQPAPAVAPRGRGPS